MPWMWYCSPTSSLVASISLSSLRTIPNAVVTPTENALASSFIVRNNSADVQDNAHRYCSFASVSIVIVLGRP